MNTKTEASAVVKIQAIYKALLSPVDGGIKKAGYMFLQNPEECLGHLLALGTSVPYKGEPLGDWGF